MNRFTIRNHEIFFKREPYKIDKGKVFFLRDENIDNLQKQGNNTINSLKTRLKMNSWLYEFLRNFLYPILLINGKNVSDFLKVKINNNQKELVVNLASGNNTKDDFINVDFSPHSNVDVIADIHDLPFNDYSVDRVILEL